MQKSPIEIPLSLRVKKCDSVKPSVVLISGMCSQFVNKELAPGSCILFFIFVLAFGIRDGEDVSVYGCMNIDISLLMYSLYYLTSLVPIAKGLDNQPEINKGLMPLEPLSDRCSTPLVDMIGIKPLQISSSKLSIRNSAF
jgi:hypothetical protein